MQKATNSEEYVLNLTKRARKAALALQALPAAVKSEALIAMADALEDSVPEIIQKNEIDLKAAEKSGLSPAMIDRLKLDEKRIRGMSTGVREISAFPDPVGTIQELQNRPSGIRVGRMRVPIGAIGFIYESRPNTTVDAAARCLKAGNSILLRGGSEAINSNIFLTGILCEAATSKGVPEGAIQIIENTDRACVTAMLGADEYLNLIIPRGGKGLIRHVVENSRIPVIKHYEGNCHVYVDREADLDMARRIVVNAKTQRPGVCNAAETLLVHRNVAQEFLPDIAEALQKEGVEIHGCPETRKILTDVKEASEEDWYTEYLALILAVRVVSSLDEAIGHINTYSSSHTDAIVTRDIRRADKFVREVDSSSVMVNASTRFSDGGEYGLGAEIGISTDRLHARGPMGVNELTTYKWVVYGDGNIRT